MRDAVDVLRAYVTERALRGNPRGPGLYRDDDSAVPRLSDAAFLDVMQLCADVPDATLRMLHFYWCEAAGVTWTEVLIEVQGEETRVRAEQVAVRYTLREAAHLAGLALTYHEARALYGHAIERVHDRMMRRARKETDAGTP